MKTALVTGGNRGIGLEICKQLRAKGFTVVMGSRDMEKGMAAASVFNDSVIAKQLDVTSEESIQSLFSYLETVFGNLDVLINNAGIGEKSFGKKENVPGKVKDFLEAHVYGARQIRKAITPVLRGAGVLPERATAVNVNHDHVRYIMETNLYGAWRMIQVMIPLLRKSEDGRIINISSGLGELGQLSGQYPAYSLSKSSLNALTIMLARELVKSGIKVNAVCPGWVKTDMGGANAPGLVSQGADTAVWLATEKVIPTGKFFRDRQVIQW
jgi:NAD(P)-dependent dehydrogenase (short-subunit alcohol dehydrogenase family)